MDVKVLYFILKTFDSNASPFFNYNIHSKLREVKKTETKYALKNPQILNVDPNYTILGPIG